MRHQASVWRFIFFARWRQHPKNIWYIFQIQITPLLWHPQDTQGCLEKQNCPLSSNLGVCCSKIGSKRNRLWKSVKKPSYFDNFLVISEVFQTFLVLGPILVPQTTKFEFSYNNFASLDTPWGPGGVKVVEWNQNQLIRSLCSSLNCVSHEFGSPSWAS